MTTIQIFSDNKNDDEWEEEEEENLSIVEDDDVDVDDDDKYLLLPTVIKKKKNTVVANMVKIARSNIRRGGFIGFMGCCCVYIIYIIFESRWN